MSAAAWLAMAVRSSSGMKTSFSRVMRTTNPGIRDSFLRTIRPIVSTTFFSFSPVGPIAPGSFPPWPGSSMTTIFPLCFGTAGRFPAFAAPSTSTMIREGPERSNTR
jgi:hypothetical protein